MHVKAAVLRQFGSPLRIETLELDEPHDGEILIRVVACGIGRSDLDAVAGRSGMPLPLVPGSEAAGFVERVGAGVTAPLPGDAVLVGWSVCGACPACGRGDERRCEAFAARNLSGRRADGSTPWRGDDGAPVGGFFLGQSGFATHLVCRARDAVAVDAGTPLEVAVAVGGDFLSGAAHLLQLPEPQAGAAVAIAGASFIGLAACMVATSRGFAPVVIAERDEARRTLALEVGATIAVPDIEGLAAVVKSLAPDGARIAVDASDTDGGRRACRDSLAPDGVSVSTLPWDGTAPRSGADAAVPSANDGISTAALLPRILAGYSSGTLPIEKLINFFPFEQVNDAIEAVETGAVIKAVLRFPLGSFGDLDRAKREGAATDEQTDAPTTEPGDETSATDPAAPSKVTA